MTPSAPEPALLGPETWIHRLQLGGRVAVTIVFLATTYFLTPTKEPHSGSDLPWLLLQLGLFALVVAIQVPAIINAKHPILRAAIALGVLVPVYLLVFARLYLSSSLSDPSAFNQPLDRASALYFTVTVFATVGFGDIVAHTDSMRILVTLQMLVNLVVVGAVFRLLLMAARRGVEVRRATDDPPGEDDPDPSP